MTKAAFLVIIAVALLVVGTEDIVGSEGHVAFAHENRGINTQTSTNQDQGCESTGETSGITNACTATSSPGSTETSVSLTFKECVTFLPTPPFKFECYPPASPDFCNNIGCQSITCVGPTEACPFNCTTDNSVQLTSCTVDFSGEVGVPTIFSCTRTEPGTGTTNSGGVTGGDAG